MSPRILRLPEQEFLSRGFNAIRTPYFSFKTKKNNLTAGRVGVVVGKSVHKTAVARNFLKRQAKEIVSKAVRPGNDLLIIFSPAVNTLTKHQLREALIGAARRLPQ